MFIEYGQKKLDIHVKRVGSTFEAINDSLRLKTHLQLRGSADVVYEGRMIKGTFNDHNEIVEKIT